MGCASSTTSISWPASSGPPARPRAGVRDLLVGLRPGMTEHEAVGLLGWNGTPLSCHLMLTAGPRATLGLLSPGDRPHRAGRPVHGRLRDLGRAQLPGRLRGRGCRRAAGRHRRLRGAARRALLRGHRRVVPQRSTWAQTGGELAAIIERHLGDPFFGIFLNPGHQIHLDEWVNSPIFAGSTHRAPVGHGLPGRRHPGHRDRLLHDQHRGRHRPRRRGPARRARRRATPRPGRGSRRGASFMREALGIDLHPDVLPFSNIPACLPPFLLRPDRAMTLVG